MRYGKFGKQAAFSVLLMASVLQSGCKLGDAVKSDGTVQAASASSVFDIDRLMDEEVSELTRELSREELMATAETFGSDVVSNPASGSFALSGSGSGKWNSAGIVSRIQALWQKSGKSACGILKPFLKASSAPLTRPYFFVGTNAQAGAGIQGVVGRDFVWDLYNLQFSSFTYAGPLVVLGAGTVGASVGAYAGLGFGVRSDVNAAWSGVFLSSGVDASLPVLADYLSGNLMGFVAGTASGKADRSFFGASVGISAGLSVPTTAPGALVVANGVWKMDKAANVSLFKRFRSANIPVSMSGANTCNGGCIRFDQGSKGASYRGRAVNLAASLGSFVAPALKGPFPGLEPMMLLALATGAYRDALNHGQVCKGK